MTVPKVPRSSYHWQDPPSQVSSPSHNDSTVPKVPPANFVLVAGGREGGQASQQRPEPFGLQMAGLSVWFISRANKWILDCMIDAWPSPLSSIWRISWGITIFHHSSYSRQTDRTVGHVKPSGPLSPVLRLSLCLDRGRGGGGGCWGGVGWGCMMDRSAHAVSVLIVTDFAHTTSNW